MTFNGTQPGAVRLLYAAIGLLVAMCMTFPALTPAAANHTKPTVSLSWLGSSNLTGTNTVTVQLKVSGTNADLDTIDRFRLKWRSKPLRSRDALENWSAGALQANSSTRNVAIEELPRSNSSERKINFTFGADDLNIVDKPSQADVFGISILGYGKQKVLIRARTFLLWQKTSVSVKPTPLTVVAPITGSKPDMLHGNHSYENVSKSITPGGLLASQTEIATIPGVTWALDPALLSPTLTGPSSKPPADVARQDSISPAPPKVETSVAQDTVKKWQQTIRQASNDHDTIVLPWLDPDLATTAASKQTQLLKDPGLTKQAQENTQQLPRKQKTVWWPSHGLSSPALLQELDVKPQDLVILGSDTFRNQDSDLAYPVSRSQIPSIGATALINDTTLSKQLNLLSPQSTRQLTSPKSSQQPTASSIATRVLAEIAVHALQDAEHPRARLISIDRDWHPPAGLGKDVISQIANSPWTQMAPLQGLVDSTEPGAERTFTISDLTQTRTKHPHNPDITKHLQQNVETIARAVSPDLKLTETIPGRQLAALATVWRGDPVGWNEALKPWAAWSEGIRHGIQVSHSSSVNIVSFETAIPVTVTNSLTVPTVVSVILDPSNNRIVPQASSPQVIPPDSRSVIQVPGRAVADGSTSIIAKVIATDGSELSSGKPFDVRIRRTWEGRAILVSAIVSILVMAFGIARGIRKKRRLTADLDTQQDAIAESQR